MADWHDYLDRVGTGEHTVTGAVKVYEHLWSPQLENWRDIHVYLPPSYGQGDRRYPVLYMHDGQNLFDDAISFAGEWQVDETLQALSADGIEAIVAGVANMGNQRIDEYTPFPDSQAGGGRGDLYLAFLVDTVKPLIDADFRTLSEAEHTGIAGSSLGGLISLYALVRRPDVFGLAGLFSPAFAAGDKEIYDYVEKADAAPGVRCKVYMDVGWREAEGLAPGNDPEATANFSRAYLEDVRAMYRMLQIKGYVTGQNLLYVEDEEGIHHESAWARRLPEALRFLLREDS